MRRAQGFTLIEIMVAVAVFAVIGLISTMLVSQVVAQQQGLTEHGTRLVELQRAMNIMKRDVLQLANRPVKDNYGDHRQPLMVGSDAEAGLIELTRSGWRNPLGHPRANLQRVAYQLQDETLQRIFWPVLDRVQDSEPIIQALLTDVQAIEFYAVDRAGNLHPFWPLRGPQTADANRRLVAVMVRAEIAPYGYIERIWEVPSV